MNPSGPQRGPVATVRHSQRSWLWVLQRPSRKTCGHMSDLTWFVVCYDKRWRRLAVDCIQPISPTPDEERPHVRCSRRTPSLSASLGDLSHRLLPGRSWQYQEKNMFCLFIPELMHHSVHQGKPLAPQSGSCYSMLATYTHLLCYCRT